MPGPEEMRRGLSEFPNPPIEILPEFHFVLIAASAHLIHQIGTSIHCTEDQKPAVEEAAAVTVIM